MITVKNLMSIAATAKSSPIMDEVARAFNAHAADFGVTTPKRIAQFLGNISHENGGFKVMGENLNYSPDGLTATFGSKRISRQDALKYGRTKGKAANQKAIANIVYGGEWGKKNLGNTEPNDGWDFRGSGIGQPTGRANFYRAEKATGIPFTTNPDKMREVDASMVAALTLWSLWGLNGLADNMKTTEIRRKWNGGSLGLREVKEAVDRGLALGLSIKPKSVPELIMEEEKAIADAPTRPSEKVEAQGGKAAAPVTIGATIIAAIYAAYWAASCSLPEWFIQWVGYAAKCTEGIIP